MGIYPIYTAAEAESHRYLGIYILTVCLSFATFKNNKSSKGEVCCSSILWSWKWLCVRPLEEEFGWWLMGC